MNCSALATLKSEFTRGARVWAGALSLSLAFAFAAQPAGAEIIVEDGVVTRMEDAPKRLQGIDVEEHLDRVLPLDLRFTDTSGASVDLARYVKGERPVIFTLNYSNCPMLCSLQLSGLAAVVPKLEKQIGVDFDIVTVSLDPKETPQRAAETEARYRSEIGLVPGARAPQPAQVPGARAPQPAQVPGARAPQPARAAEPGGWHFLTGSQPDIDALAEALGIGYSYNAERKEYVHPAVLVISTPSGRISRYLYGIEYHPKTLSLSLVEAAEGKIGTSFDRFILYCFHYDETEGRYAPVAMNIMRIGGGVTALGLGTFLGAFWLRQGRRGRRRRAPEAGASIDSQQYGRHETDV